MQAVDRRQDVGLNRSFNTLIEWSVTNETVSPIIICDFEA